MKSSLSSRALLLLGCVLASTAASAQVRYPSNPQTQAECEGPHEQWMAQYRREHEMGAQYHAQSNAIQAPQGCFGNNQCSANYYGTKKRLHELTMKHYQERDRIKSEGYALDQNCRATAKVHEQRAEQQRRMAEEQRKQQEQQQREALARQQDMQRQQQAAQQAAQQQQLAQQRQAAAQQQAQQQAYQAQQAEQQRHFAQQQRQAAEQQSRMIEQQQRIASQQQANQTAAQRQLVDQLSAMQRDAERQQARQPRVIAELPPSAYDNTPRQVQTPEMRAQAATDAAQEQERHKRAEAQALRDVLTPQGRQAMAEQVNTQVTAMSKGYSAVETARNARTDAEFDKATKDGTKAVDEANAARRRMLDLALNPNQVESKPIDRLVTQSQDLNQEINSARGISPLVTQIQGDNLSALGSMSKSTSGALDSLATSNPSIGSTPMPSRPTPTASLDELRGSATPQPKECPALYNLLNASLGKPGEQRRDGDNVAHECKNGKWERMGTR